MLKAYWVIQTLTKIAFSAVRLYLYANSNGKIWILRSCSFFDVLALWFYSFDLYWWRGGWLSINTLSCTLQEFRNILAGKLPDITIATARGQESCFCPPVCLGLSSALSLHVRLWVYGDMSSLLDCIYTQGDRGNRLQTGKKPWEDKKKGRTENPFINSNSKSHSIYPSVSVKQKSRLSKHPAVRAASECSG